MLTINLDSTIGQAEQLRNFLQNIFLKLVKHDSLEALVKTHDALENMFIWTW